MARIVSVWLLRWPILRFLAAQTCNSLQRAQIDPEKPFVLVVNASGGPYLAAANEAAEASGLLIGDSLADARAKADFLQVRVADPKGDDVALRRLALWATRYTPDVAPFDEPNGADGFFLDVSHSAHLFGGEERLLADLSRRLDQFGLSSRSAIADTPGAAWALSRFHALPNVVLPSGREAEALAALPIGSLRLADTTRQVLRRLGFKHVGALIDKPRAPFAARFESELLKRLDQALGRAPEPLSFITPSPIYRRLRHLLEPIFTQDAIIAQARRLLQDLVCPLERDGVGARSLRLTLYRVDGEVTTIDIGFALPTRSPNHVARLLAFKLERIAAQIDAGFGFETIGLVVTAIERMNGRQVELAPMGDEADRTERCAALIDGLRQRLGPRSVRRLLPVASYLPEKAEASCDATAGASIWLAVSGKSQRPLLLLPRAEPTEVVALMPEGPPRRFRWRGALHNVAFAQGPERIASEWWTYRKRQPTRDYYLLEDEVGRRFWLYREGLYGRETATPRWFLHGFFA
jgi:protein ImuB